MAQLFYNRQRWVVDVVYDFSEMQYKFIYLFIFQLLIIILERKEKRKERKKNMESGVVGF